MAINPDNITTIRVDQLPDTGITLESLIPHTNGTELNSSPVSELVTLVASAIESGIGVGFLPVSVTDGQTLPAIPTDPSFILVGAGTYINLNGFPDLICTEELNAIMSLSDHWEIAVEIPIVAPVGVQTVTGSAVDNTDPQNPVINTTGGSDVNSVNSQTGVVSIDLESVLTEGGTANDLGINLINTSNGKTLDIYSQSIFILDNDSNNNVSINSDNLLVSSSAGKSIVITKDEITRDIGTFISSLQFTDPTANRSITFKDESGTVALLSDVTGVSDGDKGDITVSSGGTVWTIDNGVVNNAKVASGIDAVKIGSGNVSNTEFDYLDGVTSAIQTQFGNKADKSMSAYSMRANNTGSTANATEFTFRQSGQLAYTDTPTFTGTAPTGASNLTYNWQQIGNWVRVCFTFDWANTGSGITQIQIPMPTDLPDPVVPTGFTGASTVLYIGTGLMATTLTATNASASDMFSSLRRNSANTDFEFTINAVSAGYKVFRMTLEYPVA
jgi:hypothetical protein